MATDPRIGTKIRRARERQRMSQETLAAALGVSRSAVNAWENDRAYPRASIGALEEVLGIQLTGDPEPSPSRSREELRDQLRRLQDLAADVAARLDDEEGQNDDRRRRGA